MPVKMQPQMFGQPVDPALSQDPVAAQLYQQIQQQRLNDQLLPPGYSGEEALATRLAGQQYGKGFVSRHPFISAIGGGLLGAGLGAFLGSQSEDGNPGAAAAMFGLGGAMAPFGYEQARKQQVVQNYASTLKRIQDAEKQREEFRKGRVPGVTAENILSGMGVDPSGIVPDGPMSDDLSKQITEGTATGVQLPGILANLNRGRIGNAQQVQGGILGALGGQQNGQQSYSGNTMGPVVPPRPDYSNPDPLNPSRPQPAFRYGQTEDLMQRGPAGPPQQLPTYGDYMDHPAVPMLQGQASYGQQAQPGSTPFAFLPPTVANQVIGTYQQAGDTGYKSGIDAAKAPSDIYAQSQLGNYREQQAKWTGPQAQADIAYRGSQTRLNDRTDPNIRGGGGANGELDAVLKNQQAMKNRAAMLYSIMVAKGYADSNGFKPPTGRWGGLEAVDPAVLNEYQVLMSEYQNALGGAGGSGAATPIPQARPPVIPGGGVVNYNGFNF